MYGPVIGGFKGFPYACIFPAVPVAACKQYAVINACSHEYTLHDDLSQVIDAHTSESAHRHGYEHAA